jgi:ABC-type multidrug transport system fused ATPase/permease subunit
VAIIGKVGCGKSTFFNAILKEALVISGEIEIKGSKMIGYAEQNPVIISGTVRSNILFGSPYDKEWYDKVVEVCQLLTDF